MWRVKPFFFISHIAPIVSASGICGFGQWISSRFDVGDAQVRQALLHGALEIGAAPARCAAPWW